MAERHPAADTSGDVPDLAGIALPTASVALLGGTGRSGPGLALRFAARGLRVLIGSRDAARGVQAAEQVTRRLAEYGVAGAGEVTGHTNPAAARLGETVLVTVPYEAQDDVLSGLVEVLAGRVVVSTVVPMRWDRETGPAGLDVPEGSAAQRAAARLPGARVVAGFHSLSSAVLKRLDQRVDGDVIVTGDDHEAKLVAQRLAALIEGVRPVDGGGLRYARYCEQLAVLLNSINGVYRAHAGVHITDLP